MNNPNPRIRLEDTLLDIFSKMSEGNPGAMTVMAQILQHGNEIDPAGFEPVMKILMLDTWGIYGSDIWVLYKNICGQNIANLITLIRAAQLGMIDKPGKILIEGNPKYDFPSIAKRVTEHISSFNYPYPVEE